jgi:hypothetical protein
MERDMSWLLVGFVAAGLALGTSAARADDDDNDDNGGGGSGPEVLTKGPVHEAFAAPVSFDASQAYVIPKAPPAPVQEVPPETKPEGANVTWIAGYWSWDEERKDFIWVSGLWRDVPPGKHWVAGSFTETSGGFQWVPGYWANDQAEAQAVVAQAPPATLETGPSSPAPSDNHIWVSGTWLWNGAWAWRPGYWIVGQPDWIWTPAYYSWTPGGYVFIDGYWDYAPVRRGYLFAPVYYGPGWGWAPSYRWQPTIVIGGDVVVAHFFCYPRYRHYYFGDYYETSWRGRGIVPYYEVHTRTYVYDPIYTHSVWVHRSEPGWSGQLRQDYVYRQQHPDARPPATYRAQQQLVARNDPRAANLVMARHAVDVARATPARPAALRAPPPRPADAPRASPAMHQPIHQAGPEMDHRPIEEHRPAAHEPMREPVREPVREQVREHPEAPRQEAPRQEAPHHEAPHHEAHEQPHAAPHPAPPVQQAPPPPPPKKSTKKK